MTTLNKIRYKFGTKQDVEVAADYPQLKFVRMEQIHGDQVAHVTTSDVNTIEGVDAVVTNENEIALVVKTADCVPILLVDNKNAVIGAAHCGWKGSLKNLTARVINEMVDAGAETDSITMRIGPSIGTCCYEIYGDRLNLFQSKYPNYLEFIETWNDKNMLNLAKLNYLQGISAGLKPQNIHSQISCTKCDFETYYSYNRDKTKNRMESYIAMV